MGHLDVWAYVIQSPRAASNRPLLQGSSTVLIDLRLASSTLPVVAQATGAIRVLRCPSHRLRRLAPPQAQTHIHRGSETKKEQERERERERENDCPITPAAPGLTLICLKRTQPKYFVVAFSEHRQECKYSHERRVRRGTDKCQSHTEEQP